MKQLTKISPITEQKQSQVNTTMFEKMKFEEWFKSELGKPIKHRIGQKYVDSKPDELYGLKPGDSAYLYGGAGRGKTYLASYLFQNNIMSQEVYDEKWDKYRLSNFPSYADCWKFKQLLEALKNNFDGADEKLRRIERTDYLFIDDIGIRMTDYSLDILERIIDFRSSNDLPTLVTSNLSIAEWGKIDSRIASRLVGLCKVKEIKGKDRRVGG